MHKGTQVQATQPYGIPSPPNMNLMITRMSPDASVTLKEWLTSLDIPRRQPEGASIKCLQDHAAELSMGPVILSCRAYQNHPTLSRQQ